MSSFNYRYLKARLSVPDPYVVLGIKPGCIPDQAQRAYIKLARTVHPDKASDHKDDQEIRQRNELSGLLNAAYDSLKSYLENGIPLPDEARHPSNGDTSRHREGRQPTAEDEDNQEVPFHHPARKPEDSRIDPLLFHIWKDREADESAISERVQRDTRNLAILRQAALDNKRLHRLRGLRLQAKTARLWAKRMDKELAALRMEVDKVKKAIGHLEQKWKAKRGVIRQPTSKQRDAVNGLREKLQMLEARMRAAEDDIEQSDGMALEAAGSAGDKRRLACGQFAEDDQLARSFALENTTHSATATTGSTHMDQRPIREVHCRDVVDGELSPARQPSSSTCVHPRSVSKAVNLLRAYPVDDQSGCLNALIPTAGSAGELETSDELRAQWHRRAVEKREKIETREAEQEQARLLARVRQQNKNSGKVMSIAMPAAEVEDLLREAKKRNRTALTKGSSRHVSVTALKESQRKADRWVSSFAGADAYADVYADYTGEDSFDYAPHEELLNATEESAQVVKAGIDTGVANFTKKCGGMLDLPQLSTRASKATCRAQDPGDHMAREYEWVKIAVSVALPLPSVSELDFLAWRRADCTVSSRLKPGYQAVLDREGFSFPRSAKNTCTNTMNASDYADASHGMNVGEALVHLDQKHGYFLDFILSLPTDGEYINVQRAFVNAIAARDVRVDDTIDAVSARWLIDRAPEGMRRRVAKLISEQGKGFFAAMTSEAGQVAHQTSPGGCGTGGMKAIEAQDAASN